MLVAVTKRQPGLKWDPDMFDYPVTLTPDDGTVLVTFADVPEAITFGADEGEALRNGIDALDTGLSFYVGAGKPLPKPSKPKHGQKTVRPSASLYTESM